MIEVLQEEELDCGVVGSLVVRWTPLLECLDLVAAVAASCRMCSHSSYMATSYCLVSEKSWMRVSCAKFISRKGWAHEQLACQALSMEGVLLCIPIGLELRLLH